MNKETVIALAREAGLIATSRYGSIDEYERFATLVAAHEREECAKVCEAEGQRIDASWSSCAEAIRSRT